MYFDFKKKFNCIYFFEKLSLFLSPSANYIGLKWGMFSEDFIRYRPLF